MTDFSTKRVVTTLLLAIALGIGLAGAILPRFRVDKPGILALLCLIAALVLGGGRCGASLRRQDAAAGCFWSGPPFSCCRLP